MRAIALFFLLLTLNKFAAQDDGEEECGRRVYEDIASLPALYEAAESPPIVPIKVSGYHRYYPSFRTLNN